VLIVPVGGFNDPKINSYEMESFKMVSLLLGIKVFLCLQKYATVGEILMKF
jgi:hypothetical protein